MIRQAAVDDAPDSRASTVTAREESSLLVVQDEEYFLDFTVFQVENRQFQLPKYLFAESEGPFGVIFTLPQRQCTAGSDGPPPEGSRANPIILEGDRADDFRAFLKVLLPRTFPPNYDALTLVEWISALKLATKYEFAGVRKRAIEHIFPKISEPGNITMRFTLGRDYHVRAWIKDACAALVNRHSPLTEDEGGVLGISATVRIGAMREERISCRSVYAVGDAVERVFANELGPMDFVNGGYASRGGSPGN